jgi:hypothetical protein
MAIRRLVRGTVPWDTLEAVGLELIDRYDREAARITFFDADNWLSTPMVVDDEFFVKVITDQNALVQGLLTAGRNLGALAAGTEGFFERLESPGEMAQHELEAARRMRELEVTAPEPIEAFEFEGVGVLVFEYLPAFGTLASLPEQEVRTHAPTVFAYLRRMHDDGLAHGDLRGANVLVADGEVYFIDATNVREAAIDDARAYDVACALAMLAPLIGANDALDAAEREYDASILLAARDFLDVVNVRPDHDVDAAALKGAIEQRASEAEQRE